MVHAERTVQVHDKGSGETNRSGRTNTCGKEVASATPALHSPTSLSLRGLSRCPGLALAARRSTPRPPDAIIIPRTNTGTCVHSFGQSSRSSISPPIPRCPTLLPRLRRPRSRLANPAARGARSLQPAPPRHTPAPAPDTARQVLPDSARPPSPSILLFPSCFLSISHHLLFCPTIITTATVAS